MKPTQEQVIAWMEEASGGRQPDGWGVMLDDEQLERFATLAYEAGQESMKWDGIHSCHPDCQRPACVHTRKAVEDETRLQHSQIEYLSGLVAEKNKMIAELQQQVLQMTHREWQGLTDEEILEEYRQSYGDDGNLTDVYFAHAIEAKLREKNT